MNDKTWYLMCWETYLEVWRMFQRHQKKQKLDWEEIGREAQQIREQHPTRMCERLLLIMMDELENRKG
jgi:hypothetical protein